MYVQCILTNLSNSVPKLRKMQISEFVWIGEPLIFMQSLVNYSNRTYAFDKIPYSNVISLLVVYVILNSNWNTGEGKGDSCEKS